MIHNTNKYFKLLIIGLGHWMVSPVYFCPLSYYWSVTWFINPGLLLRSSLIEETIFVFVCTYFHENIPVTKFMKKYTLREKKNIYSRSLHQHLVSKFLDTYPPPKKKKKYNFCWYSVSPQPLELMPLFYNFVLFNAIHTLVPLF